MSSSIVILQITDLHILTKNNQSMSGVDTYAAFCEILKLAHQQHSHIDLTLVTGDLAQQPSQSSYQRIVTELEKYSSPAICLPGNHDDFALMQQFINSTQVNCNKHYLFDQWQVISLNSKKPNSQGGYLAQSELAYLESILQKHPKLNTLIAVHHPPVETGSRWMDTMIIENNNELFARLENYPQVKAISCGHIHQSLESRKNDILILGTPATCFQFKPYCSEYTLDSHKMAGYRLLELQGNGVIKSKIYRAESI